MRVNFFVIGGLVVLTQLASSPSAQSAAAPAKAAPAKAAPASAKTTAKPDNAFALIHRQVLASLPSLAAAQSALLEYLKDKSQSEVSLPDFPDDALLDWTRNQWDAAGTDIPKLYLALFGQLLVSQKLLADKSILSQRRGLRVADDARLIAAMRLSDLPLSALVCDALILPHLDAAYPQGRSTLSRRRLLQDGASTYRLNRETAKQIVMLRALVAVSVSEKDADGADWARAKLAETLAARDQPNDLAEGVQLLRAVTSPNMTGTRDSMMKGFEQSLQKKRHAYRQQQQEEQRVVEQQSEWRQDDMPRSDVTISDVPAGDGREE